MAFNTVGDVLEAYIRDRQDAAQIRTAILRYTAPIWGYTYLGKRRLMQKLQLGLRF